MGGSKLRYKLISPLILLCLGCGSLTTDTEPPPPSPTASAPTTYAVVLGANFTDPIGTLGMVPLNQRDAVSSNLVSTHSDAMVRSFGGLLYVVNRLGADNIQVVDPADFSVTSQFSTGIGTNPQEIVAVSPTEAYVTLYQPEENQTERLEVDDLIRMNPRTGEILQTIDLTPFTANDGERHARASALLEVGGDLFVAVQDLPGNLALPPDQPGKIVRIDLASGRIEAAAILEGRNPFAMAHSPTTGMIYIACSEFFDLASPYGGIEIFDPATMRTERLLADEGLGGWMGDLEVTGPFGFVVVGSPDYSSNELIRFSLEEPDGSVEVLYVSDSYIQEIAVSPDGLLLVGDRDPRVNGVIFFDPATGEQQGDPITLGLPPSSIAFIER